jgi:hypothetical protein
MKELTHSIVVLRDLGDVAVDGTAGLGVTQHAGVVDEWGRSFVRLPVELDQHPLDVEQVTIDGIQESSGLQVLRRSAAGTGRRE